jgi:cyclopropane-fatty-acyl-phospholipid synthase
VQRTDRVLDLGFGWGGLSIRLAETVGCRVHGITLSREQHDLALERVRARGLAHLITFEIVDYRDFAAAHPGEFDRIISVEMVEAVGHNYFPAFMGALDRLLAPGGVVVLQAITMPEARYPEYIKTCDFINTIIFPGGCCPSLAALLDAMAKKTGLTLHAHDQFNLHYGETLRRWRANFNAALGAVVRPLGFDAQFIRTWNYYLTYCEAGFSTQTLGLVVLTFVRPNTRTLVTAAPAGRLADPLGPFVNDAAAPALVPSGIV